MRERAESYVNAARSGSTPRVRVVESPDRGTRASAPEPEDVIGFCAGQIAHFKVPRHVRIVDELPMTVTGKPQKFVMREWMVRLGNADGGEPEA